MMQQLVVVEVSPRDGLQNEPVVLSTDARVELIEGWWRRGRAGSRRCRSPTRGWSPPWPTPRPSWPACPEATASPTPGWS